MTLIEQLRHDLRLNIRKTLNDTEKEIVKGTVTCRGCPFEEEVRIENIDELPDEAAAHAEKSMLDSNNNIFDHHVAFDVALMPLPEIKDLDAEIRVGEDGL